MSNIVLPRNVENTLNCKLYIFNLTNCNGKKKYPTGPALQMDQALKSEEEGKGNPYPQSALAGSDP